ncbi:MAG: trypsin-like peptidase domain-containing protein [Candidatus Tectomicrobia bacterium]|nr:trypsin-like peptidase domain-containing protein [Candidatus Tectomicrobia bacterium]
MQEKLAALLVLLSLLAPSPLSGAETGPCGSKPIPELFKEASPAVVFISAVGIDPFKVTDRVTSNIGSGFFIDPKGLILTNSHVVYRRSAISVTLDDGKTLPAKLLGADPLLDLAVLKAALPGAEPPVAKLGDSNKLQVGDEVFAIGNPLGLDQTLTRGIISGLNRLLPDSPASRMLPYLQTDAAINPGNSGGPLLNRCGEVVGVTTAILPDAQNLGFAIPINLAKKVVPQLIGHGRVIRPWIGFSGRVVDRGIKELLRITLVDGYLVETIEPGSPAEKEGLRGGTFPLKVAGEEYLLGGDIVTHLNDQELSDPEKVPVILDSLKVGDKVRLRLFREGETKEVEFSLPERPILPGDLPPEDRRTLSPARHPLSPLPGRRP